MLAERIATKMVSVNYPGKVTVTISDFLCGNGVLSHGKKYPLLISTAPMLTPASPFRLPVSYRSRPIALLQFLKERKQSVVYVGLS